MQLSIVIPVFNEQESLQPLCDRLLPVLERTGHGYEVIFVNDGSRDGSGTRLDAIAANAPAVRVIHLRRNFGQTAAMMAGIDHASGDVIIPMDGDLQNDPADIPRLLEKIDEGYDVVSGWRKDRKDKALTRVIPSKFANALISAISGVHLNDYGCTLKAYRRDVIKSVRLYGEMHRFIPIYASWQGARVTQMPVNHLPRVHGESKYGMKRTVKVILDLMVIKFLSRYFQEPIYVFGGFGLFSFLLALAGFGAMVWFKYWGHKSFIQTPLPLIVTVLILIGVISIFMGLLAQMVMMTYYESQGKRPYAVSHTRNLDPGA